MSEIERRAYKECRVEADEKRLIGMPIVFDALSLDLGGFREKMSPDAVDRALDSGADVRALVDHNTGQVLGRTRAGTLTLKKQRSGLQSIIEPDLKISYASDLFRSVQRGDVSGMSFGFRVLLDDWNFDGPIPIRTVLDMELREVSVVTFPAYEQTHVEAALRSLTAAHQKVGGSRVDWLRKWHKTRVA